MGLCYECGLIRRALCYVNSWEVSPLKPPKDHHSRIQHKQLTSMAGKITFNKK